MTFIYIIYTISFCFTLLLKLYKCMYFVDEGLVAMIHVNSVVLGHKIINREIIIRNTYIIIILNIYEKRF